MWTVGATGCSSLLICECTWLINHQEKRVCHVSCARSTYMWTVGHEVKQHRETCQCLKRNVIRTRILVKLAAIFEAHQRTCKDLEPANIENKGEPSSDKRCPWVHLCKASLQWNCRSNAHQSSFAKCLVRNWPCIMSLFLCPSFDVENHWLPFTA